MSLTKEQLNGVIRQIGVEAAAAAGVFHDLPYAASGGGSSNVRMISAVVTAGGPPGAGQGSATFGFSPALTTVPFMMATVLNPVTDYAYTVNLFPNGFTGCFIGVIAEWQGDGADPLTAYPVNVGVRAEPFVAS